LSTGDLDGDDVHDNGPWSENGTWWTAVASENSDEVKEGIQAIEKSIKEDKLSAGELAVSLCDEEGIAETDEIEREGHSRLPPLFDRGACSSYSDRRGARDHPGCQNRYRTRRHRRFGSYTDEVPEGYVYPSS